MSKQHDSIHDFDLNLIAEFFSAAERQGPGSPETTLKALSFIEGLTKDSHIADLGCGTGGQTMVLGQHVQGQVTGLDMFQIFVDLFGQNAQRLGLQERVKAVQGSMDSLPFEKEELDLIWSEGAIYNIGFREGLEYWRPFLKPGGYVAVSEASWFTPDRPAEIQEFWEDAYPGIDTISNKVAVMEQAGYRPIASFIIPEECWTKYFYEPLEPVEAAFLEKHAGNTAAEGFIANQRYERELYYKYKDYYGYAFFIGQKT